MPLMSLQTGTQVGTATKHIIDPRHLHLVAFYCEGPLIDFNPAILYTSDIRELSSIGIIVDGADNIMPPDDLVRLKEVLEYKFELDGKQVVEEGGRKLGKVDGYIIDSDSFYVMKLQVRPSLLQSLSQAELLIDRSQIKEISDKRIVVKRATVAEKKRFGETIPAIDNPFRKVPHLPEAHGTSHHKSAGSDHDSPTNTINAKSD